MAAWQLDDAEAEYRRTCRALVNATRDEVASTGHTREHLSRVVELLADEARERWRCVLAIADLPG
jgi:selenocysteine lyase/cysteine desulfurase